MKHSMTERQELIIWVYSLKHFNKLKRYGIIHYVSKRMNYVIMYVDRTQQDETIQKLKKLHFVRDVELSPRREVDMDFENVLDRVEENGSLDDFQINYIDDYTFFSNRNKENE